jgi:probable phosphomutase (TIGR03848 family)
VTLLLLVRHGHTPTAGRILTGWAKGVHLSERGREQAEALVRRLEKIPIDAIYSSPLERCRETAAPLAKARGLPVRLRRDLLEVDYGEWSGRSIRQLARTRAWRAVQDAPSAVRFPGGETLRGVQARAVDAVRAIAEAHPEGCVAVITHADVVRLALAGLLGIPLDLYQRLAIDPGSLSVVALADARVKVLRVNDTGDLSGLVPPTERRGRRRRGVGG